MSNDRVGDAAEFTTHLTRLCELDHIGYDRWGAVTSGSKGPLRVINGPLWMGGRSAVPPAITRARTPPTRYQLPEMWMAEAVQQWRSEQGCRRRAPGQF